MSYCGPLLMLSVLERTGEVPMHTEWLLCVYHKPCLPDLAIFGPKRWPGKAPSQLFPFQARASHRGEPGAFVHDSGRNLNAQSALCTIPTSDLYEVTIVHRSVFTAPSGVSYAWCNGWCHVDSGESRCWIEVTPVARAIRAGALSDSQHEQRRPRRPHSQLGSGGRGSSLVVVTSR